MRKGFGKDMRHNVLKRVLVVTLALITMLGTVFSGIVSDTVYAKTIGKKNEQACDSCNAVINKETPKYRDYSSEAAGNGGNHDDKISGVEYEDMYNQRLIQCPACGSVGKWLK